MASLNIDLPEPMKKFVDDEAAACGLRGPGDYIRSLIEQAYLARSRKETEARLLVGIEQLERGESSEMTAADFDKLRENLRRKYGSESKP
jgi:hypothetical protein